MDIHKPKPWHGLREFLKEYVIIVVGVLTALGAEQGAEWLHWQEKVRAANEQMTLELSRANADAQERLALASCVDRRISQLEDQLVSSKGRWTPLPPMIPPRGGPRALMHPGRAWDDQFWKSAMSDGTVAHMDAKLQPKLARIYWQIAMIRDWNQQETAEVQALNALRLSFPLDDGTRASLLQGLERLRGRAIVIDNLAGPLSENIRAAVKVDLSMPADVIKDSPVGAAGRGVGLT